MARLYSVWESAIPLRDAWHKFAPPEDQARYAETHGALEISFARLLALVTKTDVPVEFSQDAFARQNLEREMQKKMLAQVVSGNLVCVGFRTRPKPRNRVERVPAEMVTAQSVNWDANSVTLRGYEFEDVRAISVDAISSEHRRALRLERVAVGRPGTASVIRAAIVRVRAMHPDIFAISRKIAVDMVRQEIQREHGGNFDMRAGYSDETIRRQIANSARE